MLKIPHLRLGKSAFRRLSNVNGALREASEPAETWSSVPQHQTWLNYGTLIVPHVVDGTRALLHARLLRAAERAQMGPKLF